MSLVRMMRYCSFASQWSPSNGSTGTAPGIRSGRVLMAELQISVTLATGAAACSVRDRKSTRLNSSHLGISYAVFCLKKKKHTTRVERARGTGRRGHLGGRAAAHAGAFGVDEGPVRVKAPPRYVTKRIFFFFLNNRAPPNIPPFPPPPPFPP